MADFDTTLVQKVFDVAERKRKSNIKHHIQADDLRVGFKVAKWRAFCHPKRLGCCPARLKRVLSDNAVSQVNPQGPRLWLMDLSAAFKEIRSRSRGCCKVILTSGCH
jgi:hypothetical protein